MNICVVDSQTGELLAFISDTKECIMHDSVSLINYGENEPVFEERDGKIYVVNNAWITYFEKS